MPYILAGVGGGGGMWLGSFRREVVIVIRALVLLRLQIGRAKKTPIISEVVRKERTANKGGQL